MKKERIGELSVRIVGGDDGNGAGNGPVVVLLHGYGAPGDDLVPLSRFLPLPSPARFVFPEAPLALPDGVGRAWWHLDLSLFERRARGERIDRSDDVPEALASVRAQVQGMLVALEARLGTARDRMILGGFSQGSMVALDAVLHADVRPAALALLSSTLIAKSVWTPRMEVCRDLPILQTHGKRDPLLDYQDATRLRDLLRDAGADLTFVDFPGGHELPPEALHALGELLVAHGGRA